MQTIITVEEVREKLQAGGYGGLYFPGECACELCDLAPCGNWEHEEGEEYINGCKPGHKHIDPDHPDFWIISASKEPPSRERFDELMSP